MLIITSCSTTKTKRKDYLLKYCRFKTAIFLRTWTYWKIVAFKQMKNVYIFVRVPNGLIIKHHH